MSRMGMSESAEELRQEMAMRGERALASNRPVKFVALAAIIFVCGLIFLLVSWSSMTSAQTRLSRERKLAEGVVDRLGQLKTLQARAAASGVEVSQPVTQIRSRIEAAGVEAGLKNRPPLPTTRSDRANAEGAVSTRFDYDVRDESLEALLAWVERSVAEVPGLSVYSVTISPENQAWRLRVTFSRWERAQGAS